MFIWGWSTKSIGNYLTDLQCSHCQHPNLAVVTFQKFFDIFFIPTIPLAKENFFVCPKCETQFQVNGYNINSIPKIKTPWWGFSGLFVLIAVVIWGSILSAFEHSKEKINPDNLAINDIVVLKNSDESEFPYSLVKISQKNGEKLIFTNGKYAYSTSYQAEEAAKKNKSYSFSKNTYEVSIEAFKKMDIIHIERPD